ncbi:MAG: hypothetical protein FWE97_00885 [Dehalococcoidia bacterium]|nr:hypothetical protein [Dehalococcoidia bacterium]
MIEFLACKLGRNDEIPNIELAEKLAGDEDKQGICEIAEGLSSGNHTIVNDCIKVLYEIGQRKPALIADFADSFITALSGKNNRIVWGSMTALAFITSINPAPIFNRLSEIVTAYKSGSVITIDNSISVFAQLCKASHEYQAIVFPLLLNHLANCRAKEIPQHAERIVICIDLDNKDAFLNALESRAKELSVSQYSRIMKLKKKL